MLLLPLMVGLSFDFGYTWDEKARQKYGEMVWGYLEGEQDRSFFEDGSPAHEYYGGLFDVVSVGVQRVLPRADPYVVRHAVNAVFGWGAVVGCGLLARTLFGAWPGVLAMLLLVLSPRFFAHSMNNPKDLPFATFSILALYAVFRLGRSYPYVRWGDAVSLVLTLGLALAVRAAGLLLLAYLAVAVAFRIVAARDFSPKHLTLTGARLAGVATSALLLASVTWPWAMARPLYGPVIAFFRLSKFDWRGGVLFKGAEFPATQLPWDYAPTWFLISTPFVLLLGAAASLCLARKHRHPAGPWAIAGLWSAFLLPVVLVVVRSSTMYDGIRHLLFLVPLLAVLAVAGWTALLRHPKAAIRRFSAAALCIAILEPLLFEVRNHPNEVVYFNALAGGPAGAFGRYDLDYWGNCAFQSVQWAADLARESGTAVVVTGANSPHVELNARRFPSVVYRPARFNQHHLEIYILRGAAADVRAAADKEALFRVTADGAPLCVVRRGPRFSELAGRVRSVPAAP